MLVTSSSVCPTIVHHFSLLTLFGWLWLVAGVDLLSEKSTAGSLMAGAGLVREKNTADWFVTVSS